MQITLNGLPYEISDNMSVSQLVEKLSMEKQLSLSGAVILVNDKVVPKQEWKEKKIEASASVEVLSFVSGG